MKHFLKAKLISTVLLFAGINSALASNMEVLDFETSSPELIFGPKEFTQGNFWVNAQGVGADVGSLVGAVVDGGALTDTCIGIACPTNNTSNFMAALNDGYFYFGRNDNSLFQLKSLDASFVGIGGDAYPFVSGLLLLTGYDDTGRVLSVSEQIPLFGPESDGNFNFYSFDLSIWSNRFSETYFSFVKVRGYACDEDGDCVSGDNLANYALDNLVTVPEPGAWLLLGIGLLGLLKQRNRLRTV